MSIDDDFSSIAAGQNTTLFLAKPNDKFSELPRHPEDVQPPPACVKCRIDHGDPLECDKVRPSGFLYITLTLITLFLQCDSPWHLACLTPPLTEIPPGEWFCPTCIADGPGAPVGAYWKKAKKPKQGAHSSKVVAPTAASTPEDDYDDDESSEEDVGSKRKASSGRGGASKKKRQ